MAGITLEAAQAQLDAWLAASLAVAANQSYEIDTGNGGKRVLTRANAEHCQKMVVFWKGIVDGLSASGNSSVIFAGRISG